MLTLKVGQMPGKLVEVAVEEGTSARDIFAHAGVEVSSNHEIRLDGNKISLDTQIQSNGLLVAMKMIKGNAEIYVSELSLEEIKNLTGLDLPKIIAINEVQEIGNMVVVSNQVLDQDLFDSIYKLANEEEPTPVTYQVANTETLKGKEYIMNRIKELEDCKNVYWSLFKEYDVQVKLLNDILSKM